MTLIGPSAQRFAIALLLALLPMAACVEVSAPRVVTAVTVVAERTSLKQGESVQMVGIPLNTSGGVISDRFIAWESANTNVGTVSSSGLFTGVAPGNVEVRATSEGKTGRLTVTVLPP